MDKVKTLFKFLVNKFMNMKIIKKMMLCYLLVFFIPISGLGVLYYQNALKDVQYKYFYSRQQNLLQASNNFESLFSQIKNVYSSFQYNNSFTGYISGNFYSVADEVYDYLTKIDPLFTSILRQNNYISSIKIYRYKNSFINPDYYIPNIKEFREDHETLKKRMKPGKPLFQVTISDNSLPQIKCYLTLYNQNFSSDIGIIEILVNNNIFPQSFRPLLADGKLILYLEKKYYIIQDNSENPLSLVKPTPLILRNINESPNTLQLPEIGGKLFLLMNTDDFSSRQIYLAILTVISLFILLSLVYYIIVTSVISRILKLTKHIRDQENGTLIVEYSGKSYDDEIGILIKSFNKMSQRINNLISTVYVAELKKIEAEYNALQAQIRPHFIFNTLESIRMSAEINNDYETANMLFSLGKFIRYNLTTGDSKTCLKDEIEYTINYLELYKKRLGVSFEYSIFVKDELLEYICPRYIIQPIVENSILHGFSTSFSDKKYLQIFADEEPESINIHIKDNGAGIEKENLIQLQKDLQESQISYEQKGKRRNTIGIHNVNERIKIFYGPQYGIYLDSTLGKGTTCIIRLGKLKK